ncbi:MAG TPA: DUF4340 domain-containing protein [Gemmatimonadales bacterium]|nr:DUF4340 domain-containing protein [Gemmatimonadales bacterium]
MSARQLLRVALVFLGLLVLWGAAALGRRQGYKGGGESLRLPAVARTAVDTIVLTKAGDSVVLARKDSTAWTANGFPASSPAVSDLLGAVADSATGEVVAERKSSQADLGVDSAGGTVMRVKAKGKTLLELVAGNRSPDFSGGYVRLPDQERTYLVRGRLVEAATRPHDEWRDHRIAAVPADSIGAVEIARGSKRYELRRVGGQWSLSSGGTVDSSRVASLLAGYRTIQAGGFATVAQADSARFTPPDRRLRLARKDGSPLLTLLFDSTAAGMRVKSDTGTTVYTMDAYAADELAPADSTLRPAKPARQPGKR